MSLEALRSTSLVAGAIAFCLLHVSTALGQGSGVINPPQVEMPMIATQTKATEADGTAIVNLQVTIAFQNPSSANTWDSQHPLTIGFTTENGTAKAGTCGTAGADYVAASSSVTFTGQASQTASIQVCGDALSEGDEQFGLRFTATENHANFFISIKTGNPTSLTITDDEPLPSLSITPEVQVSEPSSGTASATFTVSLTGPISQRPVTVDFNTSPGTAGAGTACPKSTENVDYLTKSGTLSFAPPANLLQSPQIPRTQQVSVSVCSDKKPIEGAETFFVNLSRPVNAVLAGAGGLPPNLTSPPTLTVIKGTATIK
ncbi:MAG TPA: Calx-beta domain-containing protein [Gemmatimonadota bacterium]|jgi:hypothetical protein